MKLKISSMAALAIAICPFGGCDAKKAAFEKGREAVKEAVTQPFNALDSAKDSLKRSDETKSRPRSGQRRNQIDRASPSRDCFAMQKSLIPVIPSLARDLVFTATYEGKIPWLRRELQLGTASTAGKSKA